MSFQALGFFQMEITAPLVQGVVDGACVLARVGVDKL